MDNVRTVRYCSGNVVKYEDRRYSTCAFLALALVMTAALTGPSAAVAWTWPLGGSVLRPYSLGPDAYAAGQHRGIDVQGRDGEPVIAPATGVVSFAGSVPTHGRTDHDPDGRWACRLADAPRQRRRHQGRRRRRGYPGRRRRCERGAGVALRLRAPRHSTRGCSRRIHRPDDPIASPASDRTTRCRERPGAGANGHAGATHGSSGCCRCARCARCTRHPGCSRCSRHSGCAGRTTRRGIANAAARCRPGLVHGTGIA